MIAQKVLDEVKKTSSFSVVDFVDFLLEDAFFAKVSDIHLQPTEKNIRIRFRVDGLLQDIADLQSNFFPEISFRIKILSNLRTDEQKNPQDGRFRYKIKNFVFDVRVSFVPVHYGESIVLRLLTDRLEMESVSNLGFYAEDEKIILNCIKKYSGMILITGPTGSGKTTTLYTILKLLNSKDVSVVTIEDPVEYFVSGIKQIQTNSRIGLSFANGLRSILRQDPDIIMVGEIRDVDTAKISINIALTGHLLLSTLHTTDSATAILRFLDMGVEPFLVASTLRMVIAQRLVRKICKYCKCFRELSQLERRNFQDVFGHDLISAYAGTGCDKCGFTGYGGRIVVSEILVVDDFIRDLIISRSSSKKIKDVAVELGMVSLVKDGVRKIENGLTTVEEILRCLNE
jgi:type IV pilus assembly protein PilB